MSAVFISQAVLGSHESSLQPRESCEDLMRVVPIKQYDEEYVEKKYQSQAERNKNRELIIETGFLIFQMLMIFTEAGYMQREEDKNWASEINKLRKAHMKKATAIERFFLTRLVLFFTHLGKLLFHYVDLVIKKLETENIKENKLNKTTKKLKDSKIYNKALRFFFLNTGSIEFVRDDYVETIYFPKLPIFSTLEKKVKENFNEKVDRSSTQSKTFYLQRKAVKISKYCHYLDKLDRVYQSNKLLDLLTENTIMWRDMAVVTSFLMNIMIIGSYGITASEEDTELDLQLEDRIKDRTLFWNYEETTTETTFFVVGLLMVVFSTLVSMFGIVKSAPFIVANCWKPSYSLFRRVLTSFFKVLGSMEVVYLLTYQTLAFLGLLYNPLFFSFHLTIIFKLSPTLSHVLMAVYMPKRQLFLAFVLLVVLVYILSVFGYAFLFEYYGKSCEGMFYCFLTTFDQTFKANGAVGGFFNENISTTDDHDIDYVRFFFDNAFNLIVVIIMINIVSGIIIDTFGLLRNKENEMEEDREGVCFICGLDRDLFEKGSTRGFGQHVREEHYLWNYVFFLGYLENKNKTDYTGSETYISQCVSRRDISWFPLMRTRKIEAQSTEEDNDRMTQALLDEIAKLHQEALATLTLSSINA